MVTFLKLTAVRTWKWMLGRRSFPLGVRPIFRGEVLVFGSVALRRWLKNEGLHRHTHTHMHTKFCCIDTQYDGLSRLCWVSMLNFRRIYIRWHWFIPEITLLRWVIKHAYEWFSMHCSSFHTGSANLSRKQDRGSCKTWIWCWNSNFVFIFWVADMWFGIRDPGCFAHFQTWQSNCLIWTYMAQATPENLPKGDSSGVPCPWGSLKIPLKCWMEHVSFSEFIHCIC